MQPISPVFSYQSDVELDYRGCLFRYPGRAGQAVRRLKYQRSTSLAEYMAEALSSAVAEEGLEFDIAVPVPIHWFRLAWRGFNQAELLCSGIPRTKQCMRRTRPTRPQAGLSTAERLTNLEGAFEVAADVVGKRVLLVDDVVTSGRTAKECAKALKLAGATEVGILAFCGESLSGVSDVEHDAGS